MAKPGLVGKSINDARILWVSIEEGSRRFVFIGYYTFYHLGGGCLPSLPWEVVHWRSVFANQSY